MNDEKELIEVKAVMAELKARKLSAADRIEAIPQLISELENNLVDDVLAEKHNYAKSAVSLYALQLELKTLPHVVRAIQQQMHPIQSRLEQIVNHQMDVERAAKIDALVKQIYELKSEGFSPKSIWEKLNITEREFNALERAVRTYRPA